jgi:hypothetical protein
MCSKNREFQAHVIRAITSEGATIIGHRVTGSAHRRIDFTINGKLGCYFFSSTPTRGKDLKAIATAKRVVRKTRGIP